MRAVVCPRAPIPPSGLLYTTTHPTPTPRPGHVLIRVHAFGLNRSELFTRQGHSPGIHFPRILGIECVGVVVDPGDDDSHSGPEGQTHSDRNKTWKEGDVVAAIMGGMGRQFDGGYGEYTLIPHANVSAPIALPHDMGWAEFGAIPETFLTAWGTLQESLKLQRNDTLLIHGGTTSVGLACTSLAKSSLFQCGRVISTTRSEAKVARVKEGGADIVLLDKDNSVADAVREATDGKGADKCVELVGGPTLMDSCRSVGREGVVSYIGCVSGEWVCKEFDPGMALAPKKHLTMFGSGTVDISKAPLQWIVDAVARRELPLGLDKVFKMEHAGEAHAYMENNSAAGKVVCVID